MTNDENYQDTFCDWVGEIPKSWNMTRGRFLFNSKKEINRELQCENLLSLTLNGVLNKDYQSSEGLRPENYNTYQIFQKDDLVFKMIDLENIKTSRVGLVHEEGIMSPVYIRHEPIKEKINPKFAYWFYYDLYKKEIYNSIGSGVRSSLSTSDLLEIELPVPPIQEQKLISRYLDKKTIQTDSLIEKIKKKIDLLKEQRTSLINHYVTKGLDPNVEMKDSGIEWIGEIPKHWTIVRLRFLCDIKTGGKDTQDNVENGSYPFFVRSPNVERINSFSFDGEAVLTSGDGAGVGKIFHYYVGKFDYHQRVYKFSNFKDVSGKYFYWYLKENFQYEILRWNAKSTVDSVRLPFLQNFPMVLPPIEEQENLLLKIDSIDDRVEKLIQRLMKKIEILREYRQSLISSFVTGKVRITEDMI